MSYFIGEFKDIPQEMKHGVMAQRYLCPTGHVFLSWVTFESVEGVARLPMIPCPECNLSANPVPEFEDME